MDSEKVSLRLCRTGLSNMLWNMFGLSLRPTLFRGLRSAADFCAIATGDATVSRASCQDLWNPKYPVFRSFGEDLRFSILRSRGSKVPQSSWLLTVRCFLERSKRHRSCLTAGSVSFNLFEKCKSFVNGIHFLN